VSDADSGGMAPGYADARIRSGRGRTMRGWATPERTIVRLLTGHKGSGKTTELFRVRSQLERGDHGAKVFVSTLYAQRWLDIDDVAPEDLVLQIVRQLVADLQAAAMGFAAERFESRLAVAVGPGPGFRAERPTSGSTHSSTVTAWPSGAPAHHPRRSSSRTPPACMPSRCADLAAATRAEAEALTPATDRLRAPGGAPDA
jgi:hypothetical protein